jgi:uncharacterized membrane protein
MDDVRRSVARSVTVSTAVSMLVIAGGVIFGVVSRRGLEVPVQADGLPAAIGQWSPGAIVLLGILLLTLSPLAHIGAAATAFARAAEKRYLWIAIGVGGMLLGSLVVAILTGQG